MIASIIIPTYNRYFFLRDLIHSLDLQVYDKNDFEIIIVDNGSTDDTRSCKSIFEHQYPQLNIKYLLEPTPGLLSGRHTGAIHSSSDILIFVDDDIITTPNWLCSIVDSFEKYPDINLIGGRNLPLYKSIVPSWVEYFWSENVFGKVCGWLSLLDFGEIEKVIPPGFVWGLNYSIRKSALFELGGFHPDNIPDDLQYFQGDGESGLSAKAEKRKMSALYQPDALVYHQIPESRLTYHYFEKRAFYQGVCNSYSNIRRLGKVTKNYPNSVYKKLKYYLSIVLKGGFKKAYLTYKFERKNKEGYKYHQNAVLANQKLYDWVMKEDYWDFKLPNIKIIE